MYIWFVVLLLKWWPLFKSMLLFSEVILIRLFSCEMTISSWITIFFDSMSTGVTLIEPIVFEVMFPEAIFPEIMISKVVPFELSMSRLIASNWTWSGVALLAMRRSTVAELASHGLVIIVRISTGATVFPIVVCGEEMLGDMLLVGLYERLLRCMVVRTVI